MGLQIAFWILAVVGVGAALGVVFVQDIFHAALFLVLCFFTVAGIYVTLEADFLAVVQVLIYVGAISVLLIFAIMLTRETQQGNPTNKLRIPVLISALVLMGTMIYTMVRQNWGISADNLPVQQLPATGNGTTGALAGQIFSQNGFVLPLEIGAVLLLAAIIGAIVMMREK